MPRAASAGLRGGAADRALPTHLVDERGDRARRGDLVPGDEHDGPLETRLEPAPPSILQASAPGAAALSFRIVGVPREKTLCVRRSVAMSAMKRYSGASAS